MALKIDGKEEYALLINENRFDGELNSKEKVLQFLSNQYLSDSTRILIGQQSGFTSKESGLNNGKIEQDNYLVPISVFIIVSVFLILIFGK